MPTPGDSCAAAPSPLRLADGDQVAGNFRRRQDAGEVRAHVPVQAAGQGAAIAVIAWRPTASADVVNVADPLANVAVPSVVVPFKNATVPVGVPVPEVGLTVAVNVTV